MKLRMQSDRFGVSGEVVESDRLRRFRRARGHEEDLLPSSLESVVDDDKAVGLNLVPLLFHEEIRLPVPTVGDHDLGRDRLPRVLYAQAGSSTLPYDPSPVIESPEPVVTPASNAAAVPASAGAAAAGPGLFPILGGVAVLGAAAGGGGGGASGNSGTVSGTPLPLLPSSPQVIGVAISGESSTNQAKPGVLVAGEKVKVVVSMSENVTVSGAPTFLIDVGGVSKVATYSGGSGSKDLTFSYTVASGDADASGGVTAPENALKVPSGSFVKSGSGAEASIKSPAVETSSVAVDTTGPVLVIDVDPVAAIARTVSTFKFNFSESISGFTTEDVIVEGATKGVLTGGGQSYSMVVTPPAGASGVMKVRVSPSSYADVAGNQGTQATEISQQYDTTYLGSPIDLGSYGRLIHPVKVDNNWYYYWDRSGDNTSSDTGNLNGGRDWVNHDVLDGIFVNDINGVRNSTERNHDGEYGTTDTYRFATLNGFKVALPRAGIATFRDGFNNGTAIDNVPVGETNPTYDDLLAIWDAFNGNSLITGGDGLPQGWRADDYWSATSAPSRGHVYVDLNTGLTSSEFDNGPNQFSNMYVALQVL
jgi:hypothetical protein